MSRRAASRLASVVVIVAAVVCSTAACSASSSSVHGSAVQPTHPSPSLPPSPSPSTSARAAAGPSSFPHGWVDQQVSFTAAGLRIYATYRHPLASAKGPAALLIAGSGIPDRNGDSPGAPEGSLRLLADQLALDGVATLRYDKLGSGRTGLGPYARDPASVRVSSYSSGAAAALRFLAAQRRTDRAQLSVFGHSEGALYALLLATGQAGPVPRIARLGLIEPLSRRNFDVVAEQLDRQYDQAERDGTLSAAAARTAKSEIAAAIRNLRAGRSPGTYPPSAAAFFGPLNVGYEVDEDRYDPAALASKLGAGVSVLLTCSTNDVQVSCGDTDHLDRGLLQGRATVTYARLRGMDHALKPDTTADSAHDDAPLPMAAPLAAAIARFVR